MQGRRLRILNDAVLIETCHGITTSGSGPPSWIFGVTRRYGCGCRRSSVHEERSICERQMLTNDGGDARRQSAPVNYAAHRVARTIQPRLADPPQPMQPICIQLFTVCHRLQSPAPVLPVRDNHNRIRVHNNLPTRHEI